MQDVVIIYKIAVARVKVWETAAPPNFIWLCVLLLVPTLAALVSPHHRSRYELACDNAHRVDTHCARFIMSMLALRARL